MSAALTPAIVVRCQSAKAANVLCVSYNQQHPNVTPRVRLNMRDSEVLVAGNAIDRERWRGICQNLPNSDVYYLPEYALIYERNGDGVARCFVHKSDHGVVLYPFLLRPIDDSALPATIGRGWYDTSTPYGYGGPLVVPRDLPGSTQLVQGFLAAFHSYCAETKVVSEFARLHPLLTNQQYLPGEDTVLHHETVFLNLHRSEEKLWTDVRKGHRSSIKKAERSHVKVEIEDSLDSLRTFFDLYAETMRRQGASAWYFLSPSFFDDTLRLLSDHAFLFVARHEGAVVSAAIFMQYNNYAQYHFAASATDSLHLCANHLLIWEAARWARGRGANYLHLGGGVSPHDALFTFKSGFSSLRANFYTYRKIHDPTCYERLVYEESSLRTRNGINLKEGFFPQYRA